MVVGGGGETKSDVHATTAATTAAGAAIKCKAITFFISFTDYAAREIVRRASKGVEKEEE